MAAHLLRAGLIVLGSFITCSAATEFEPLTQQRNYSEWENLFPVQSYDQAIWSFSKTLHEDEALPMSAFTLATANSFTRQVVVVVLQ